MAHLSLTEFFPQAFLNDSNQNPNLGEEFSLCENGNMVFHWADYHETCDAVKTGLEAHPEMHEEFKRKEAGLQKLALIPVWLRTDKKVHQTTMFDLYERYLLNQVHLSLGVDPFGPIELSFISSTGPFRTLAIAECFNKSTYKDFVMLYLLQGKLPKRDYRIRLKSKVLMEYGKDFGQAGLINLEQLTMNGLLFSLDSDFFLNEVSRSEGMRILIDTQTLETGCTKDLPGLKEHLSHFAFNLMYSSRKEDSITFSFKDLNTQSSFDFLKNKKVYLFVTYDKLTGGSNANVKSIKHFVTHTRDLIREHFKVNVASKSA